MNDQAIEQEIQAKGKTAPRITPDRINEVIDGYNTFNVGAALRALNVPSNPANDLLTMCVITLANGFTVTGESACASPENFDQEIGNKIAYDNAKQKIWMLEGYVLKCQLADAAKDLQSAAAAQASRPTQNCVFKFCPDEADCRANGCSMGAAPDSVTHHPV